MLNDDPNIAALQSYTIKLYAADRKGERAERRHAHAGRLQPRHDPGALGMAQGANAAIYETLGIGARLASAEEIVADCPIVDPTGLLGGLFDPHEGALDPHGATHAFAGAAKKRGADVVLRNRVLALTALPDGRWRLDTERGSVTRGTRGQCGGPVGAPGRAPWWGSTCRSPRCSTTTSSPRICRNSWRARTRCRA